MGGFYWFFLVVCVGWGGGSHAAFHLIEMKAAHFRSERSVFAVVTCAGASSCWGPLGPSGWGPLGRAGVMSGSSFCCLFAAADVPPIAADSARLSPAWIISMGQYFWFYQCNLEYL